LYRGACVDGDEAALLERADLAAGIGPFQHAETAGAGLGLFVVVVFAVELAFDPVNEALELAEPCLLRLEGALRRTEVLMKYI